MRKGGGFLESPPVIQAEESGFLETFRYTLIRKEKNVSISGLWMQMKPNLMTFCVPMPNTFYLP